MTDRLKGVWVAFDRDLRDDDAEALISAIRCLRHVVAVEPSILTPDDWLARSRITHELGQKLLAVLYPDSGDGE